MKSLCTQDEWWQSNSSPEAISYYKITYPFLQKMVLPIDMDYLRKFYIEDTRKRHLEPNPVYADCYEFVFSYFLENYNKPDSKKPQGKTGLERILENLPNAINKTFKDISKPLTDIVNSLPNPTVFLILMIIVLFLWSRIK